jgi:hypothetical protein
VVLPKESSCTGICRQSPDFYIRVGQQQTKELSACITGGTGHGCSYSHSHEYAMHDNFMHASVSDHEYAVRLGVDGSGKSRLSNRLIAQPERQSGLP